MKTERDHIIVHMLKMASERSAQPDPAVLRRALATVRHHEVQTERGWGIPMTRTTLSIAGALIAIGVLAFGITRLQTPTPDASTVTAALQGLDSDEEMLAVIDDDGITDEMDTLALLVGEESTGDTVTESQAATLDDADAVQSVLDTLDLSEDDMMLLSDDDIVL